MPTNPYTASIIQSIPSDEVEFRDYLANQFPERRHTAPQVSKPCNLYHCPCGLTIATGQSKHISGTVYYGSHGDALENGRCPKCDRELPGAAKKEEKKAS